MSKDEAARSDPTRYGDFSDEANRRAASRGSGDPAANTPDVDRKTPVHRSACQPTAERVETLHA
ncbi:hypothetical protein [Bradyrhizobium sp. McL0616]|uniref:hypothetical protein n=1 Tax=Bradyrhizobium sp. McL0616 TaxID=3415674 RepID=UPI003CF1F674